VRPSLLSTRRLVSKFFPRNHDSLHLVFSLRITDFLWWRAGTCNVLFCFVHMYLDCAIIRRSAKLRKPDPSPRFRATMFHATAPYQTDSTVVKTPRTFLRWAAVTVFYFWKALWKALHQIDNATHQMNQISGVSTKVEYIWCGVL